MTSRRGFLAAGLAAASLPLHTLAAPLRNKVKITDVKVMIVRGTWDWNLVKIETDAGISGIGEAYWGPGVKDLILNQLKPLIIGEDPLNVDKLYTKMLMKSAGAGAIGGVTVTAASGIEIALWDLAGRLLDTPAVNLLGGKFRDKVRFYRTHQVIKPYDDKSAYRDYLAQAKADKFGFNAFKFQGDGIPPAADPDYKEIGHDPYLRNLTPKDLRRIALGMEWVREFLGPDTDFAVEAHWRYDVNDAIAMGKAIEPVKPMWIEDPVPPDNIEAMARVTHALNIPVCTGENLYGRHGFRKLIEMTDLQWEFFYTCWKYNLHFWKGTKSTMKFSLGVPFYYYMLGRKLFGDGIKYPLYRFAGVPDRFMRKHLYLDFTGYKRSSGVMQAPVDEILPGFQSVREKGLNMIDASQLQHIAPPVGAEGVPATSN